MLKNLNKIAKDTNFFLKKYLKKQKYSGLFNAMNYGLFPGGKKIRSKILIDVGKIFNVNYSKLIIIGAAVECVHAYSLIHDDLPSMDNDFIRRGKPSTHVKFDEATAVLAGNSLLTLAFEILSDKKLNLNINYLIKSINRSISLIVIANPNSPTGTLISKFDLEKIIKDKDNFVNKIISHIHNDTICYFSKTPKSLLQLQIDSWKPLLKWIKKTYSVELNYSYSFEPLIQNKNNVQIIKEILVGCDIFKLSGIGTLCQLTGSLVISLALCDSRLTCEEAFKRDPEKVLEFHQIRDRKLEICKPHLGHKIISDIPKAYKCQYHYLEYWWDKSELWIKKFS